MAKKAHAKKRVKKKSLLDLESVLADGMPKRKLVSVKSRLKKHFEDSAAGNPLHPDHPKVRAMAQAMDQFLQQMGGAQKMLDAHQAAANGVLTAKPGLENICGAFIGRKYTEHGVAPGLCIRFHVNQKLANASDIDSSALIPKFIKIGKETFPTDVVETGPIRAHQGVGPQNPANGNQKTVRIPAGSSISGVISGETGTIGALCVVDEDTASQWIVCALTNNHVAADNNQANAYADPNADHSADASPIMHAGKADTLRLGVPADNIERIGVLYRFQPLDFTGPNDIDAALVFVDANKVSSRHSSFTIDPSPMDAYTDMRVKKEGRTTAYTEGTVDGLNGAFTVTYTVQGRNVPVQFQNQISIYQQGQPFSMAGDSGSLVCEVNSSRPVGLLFCGNDYADPQGRYYTFANPISSVMKALNISKFLPDAEIFDQ